MHENTIQQHLLEIKEQGFTVVPNVLPQDTLKKVREIVYRCADDDKTRNRGMNTALAYDESELNVRIWNILSRDPVFEDLAFHPTAIAFVKAVIGWPALLGNISGNITLPGGGAMTLHADQMFVPEPWSKHPQGVNVAWCIDDFTDENGATRYVPGSHKLNRGPRKEELEVETQALEAEAGSIVVFESRLWHRTGDNRSQNSSRAGVFGWYTKPIYRTQENWFLSLRPEVRQFASEEALVLLGYKTSGLGLMNGVSPD